MLEGRAGAHAAETPEADVVIVDPPRKGLDPELLAALAERPPGRLVHVACGLDAFLAEARTLLAGGRVALGELLAFDLFPWTEHVETVAVFERA